MPLSVSKWSSSWLPTIAIVRSRRSLSLRCRKTFSAIRMAAACQRSHTQPRGELSPADATLTAKTPGWPHWLRPLGVLSAPARLDRAAARLFLRSAAGAVGRDAARVDGRPRRRSRHHRPAVAGRPAVHAQVHLGAGGRCLARAVAVGAARAAPRLARRLAARCSWRRSCSSARAIPIDGAAGGRPRRAASSPSPRRRRTSSSTPTACRAWPSTSRRPAWPATSPPTASACWRRARASSGSRAWLEAQGLSKAAVWPIAYGVAALLVLVGLVRRAVGARAAGARGASRGGDKIGSALARVLSHGQGRLRRFPVARCGARRAGLRRALQAVRRAGRHHDGAVRAVARLRQGARTPRSSRASGLAALLVGGFAGGAVARALPLATALWLGAILQMFSNLAFVWLGMQPPSAWALTVAIVRRELHRRHRHGDLRRLPVGAVPQPAAHGDAVRAADRARLDRAHAACRPAPASSPRASAGRCSSSARRWPRCRRWP